jgi:hypothetical protein
VLLAASVPSNEGHALAADRLPQSDGQPGANQGQELRNLCRVDPACRIALALLEGVSDYLEPGVPPQRPRPGGGLGGVAPLLSEPPDPACGQHRQLGVCRVVADGLPVGQLRIAHGHHPLGRNLADQLGRRRADQASTMGAAHRELNHQVALSRVSTLHVQLRPRGRRDLDVRLHGRGRGWRACDLSCHHAQVDPAGRPRLIRRRGLCERGRSRVGERIVHDHQQVDVAATREVVAEGQRAVQDHPGDRLPERVSTGTPQRPGEPQHPLGRFGGRDGRSR